MSAAEETGRPAHNPAVPRRLFDEYCQAAQRGTRRGTSLQVMTTFEVGAEPPPPFLTGFTGGGDLVNLSWMDGDAVLRTAEFSAAARTGDAWRTRSRGVEALRDLDRLTGADVTADFELELLLLYGDGGPADS